MCRPYSISKFANEQLVEFFGVRYDVQCTSIRSSSAYGPFQNPSKLIPYIITNGLEGKSILLNSPDIAIDYIFVQDVARAISCAVDKDVPGGTVNIGSSEPITVHELVSAIECIMSKKLDVSYSKKTRLNENSRRFSSIDKAKKYLGWNPTTSIEDGLRQTVDWYEKNYAKE